MAEKITVAVLTVSTSAFAGTRKDKSGSALCKLCGGKGFSVIAHDIVDDSKVRIMRKLKFYTDKQGADIVLTTGGTGFGPADITPEATDAVIERIAPGIPELIRMSGFKKTKTSALSRGIAGIRKKSLIINLPGSPKGAEESFEAAADLLPHAVKMLNGGGH
ncbi:MogA/MoaB family molybdenum cofactor biosynthesis protein [bacterium]|nr:MogA/MoaB family molybdenum cofactor biosynthesis protein [bacterium]MBU3955567.1 MogA/MoaB family molybdenum cofactor biosynthesis protein [bacterium]MBU4133795.1 MogA/MoaB family molybdenum cofactor biosynthesis protein [bacterium]